MTGGENMKIRFIGAAHEVTGSCTLLEVGGRFALGRGGHVGGEAAFASREFFFGKHAHIVAQLGLGRAGLARSGRRHERVVGLPGRGQVRRSLAAGYRNRAAAYLRHALGGDAVAGS